ncbi:hypothetical protein D3C71_1239950 [compost metagenome]
MVKTRLVDEEAHGFEVVKHAELLQRTERIELQLWVLFGINFYTAPVFQIVDLQLATRDDHSVGGTE